MKIATFILLSGMFFMLQIPLNAQSSLEVEILNLRSSKGYVAIELVDTQKEKIQGLKIKVTNKACKAVFKDLKDGQYAIQYFHDENNNDKMETNWIGIPAEGYGFSNDPHGMFGPKSFKNWLIEVSGNTRIKVRTKY